MSTMDGRAMRARDEADACMTAVCAHVHPVLATLAWRGYTPARRADRPFMEEAVMTRVRVAGFALSVDGYGAGPDQGLDDPLGKRGRELHEWAFGTKTFRAMTGEGGGADGVDEDYAARAMAGFGAFILGRNMFGPQRGEWPDDGWRGWWGDDPPYHTPVFVLTHHARAPIEMEGGTMFHFVTDGIQAALVRAKAAAGG
jgi:dihydrofolate reductase